MKKKILMSLFTIALVGALITGGVMAVFTDTDSSNPNTFNSGTLIIDIVDTPVMTFADSKIVNNMKPGDMVTYTFKVSNVGTLPLNYTVSAVLTGDIMLGRPNQDPFATISGCSGSLAAGANEFVAITVTLPMAANNDYQGKTGNLAVTVDATQQ